MGVSKLAGMKALKETTLTRAFLPIPIISLPPAVMMVLERLG